MKCSHGKHIIINYLGPSHNYVSPCIHNLLLESEGANNIILLLLCCDHIIQEWFRPRSGCKQLYEEGEVEHINGVWPVFLLKTAIFSSNNVIIVVTSGVWPQLQNSLRACNLGLWISSKRGRMVSLTTLNRKGGWEGLLICSTSPSSYNSE